MDIDELKKSWDRMNSELTQHDNSCDGMLHSLKSLGRSSRLTGKLSRRFGVLAAISFMFVFMTPHTSAIFGDKTLNTVIALYFSLSALASLVLCLRVRRIDLCTLPVADALREIINLRILRGRIKMAGITACSLLVAYMLFDLWKSAPEALPYALSGAVIGLISGLRIDRITNREIQELKTILQKELES